MDHAYERAFADQGKAINDKVRLHARVGAALVDAREQGRDPFAAIEAIVPWESFSASVREAAELARDQDFDALSLIGEHYPQLRRYAPALIETLQLQPAPVARELIEAVKVLQEMFRDGLRKVPQNARLGFIRRRWMPYVLGPDGIDRRFYEVCIMAELKNSLRSDDVSVAGSRQFRDFEDYHDFGQTLAAEVLLGVPVRKRTTAYARAIAPAVAPGFWLWPPSRHLGSTLWACRRSFLTHPNLPGGKAFS